MRFHEYDKSSQPQHTWQSCAEYDLSTSNGKLVLSTAKPKTTSHPPALVVQGVSHKIKQLCKDLFFPIGYPNSVADGYLEYQFYDSLQGLCSYLRGVVSTSAVLSATGVGNAEATAMSAAMTWAVRDGLGMIGGLLFSYIASPHFDAHVKEFRLLADVLNDIGMTIDMALPILLSQTWITNPLASLYPATSAYLPSSYLILTSTSTLCKVACGMAAGATKGNITDHFAISGNRADCQSKESTQETLVSLIGMCCGIWLAKILHKLEKGQDDETCDNAGTCSNVTDAQMISWGIFMTLTLLHVWANYIGMQVLHLRTLNRERAKVALQPLIEDCGKVLSRENKQATITLIKEADSKILSPKSIAESLWNSMSGLVYQGNIRLGVRLKDLVRKSSSSYIIHYDAGMYMILIDEKSYRISVILRVGATDHDELKAFMHAHIIHWSLHNGECTSVSTNLPLLLSRSYAIVHLLTDKDQSKQNGGVDLYNSLAEKGWDMTRLYLGFGPFRCDWKDSKDS